MSLFKPSTQRRLVLVLSDRSYADLTGKQMAELESGHDLQVVNVSDVHSATDDAVAVELVDSGALRAGSLLAQNPMKPDTYVDVDGADRLLARDKSHLFARLCQCLGASSVEFRHTFRSADERTRKGVVDAHVGPAGGNVGVTQSQRAVDQALQSITSKFGGSAPDLAAARELVREHRLDRDPDVLSLLLMRERSDNPLKEHVVKLSVNRELVRSLDVVAELSASKILPAKIGARYEGTVTERAEIEAEYSVKFGRSR